jgi:hypothetical protein
MVALVEASSSREAVSDHESQSGDSQDIEIGSDTSTRLKVAVAASLVGITYDIWAVDYDENPPRDVQKPRSLFSQGI